MLTIYEGASPDQVTSGPDFDCIDHIAVAVRELEAAISLFCGILGFKLKRRREIRGTTTGMIAAEIEHNGIKIVLCQGTEPESQVSRLVAEHGPGIAHIAFRVENAELAFNLLKRRGLTFDTPVISTLGLTQVFSSRDSNSGFSFEFIARDGEEEFREENIHKLFDQLEKDRKY